MTKSPNKISSANYSQNWSIPNFEQLSTEEKVAQASRGPHNSNKQVAPSGNPMFRNQSPEARSRQAALEAYTDSRSQSVVARIAQIEVEGLRRRENVPVDEDALQNYAYQDNDTSFQEATFARLNRYISANHNDIYVKALRNKASSLVGENGQNITPRLFPNNGGSTGGTFTGQSSSYLGGIRGNSKQISTSYPSYQSYESNGGAAVVSKRIVNRGVVRDESSFVTAQQAKHQQAQQAAMAAEGKFVSAAQAQSQAARFALEEQQRAQQIADRQRAAAQALREEEENDKILLHNSNTFIVSNSPLATAEYENSERLYEEEVAANKEKAEENYGPRTVISVHERTSGDLPEEVVEMDYVYSDDEIEAPAFLTEDVPFRELDETSELDDAVIPQFFEESVVYVDPNEEETLFAPEEESQEYDTQEYASYDAGQEAAQEVAETAVAVDAVSLGAEATTEIEVAPVVEAAKPVIVETNATAPAPRAQRVAVVEDQPQGSVAINNVAVAPKAAPAPKVTKAPAAKPTARAAATAAPKAAASAQAKTDTEPQRRMRRRVQSEEDAPVRVSRRRNNAG